MKVLTVELYVTDETDTNRLVSQALGPVLFGLKAAKLVEDHMIDVEQMQCACGADITDEIYRETDGGHCGREQCK